MDGLAFRGTATGGLPRRLDALLGPLAAAMLGLAAGFFCFAMPARIVARLIEPFGLSVATAATQGALALTAALLVGGATWAGFRRLDRPTVPRRAAMGDAPVLRRADAHPDAPARRPIFAGSDLGTPLDLIDPLPFEPVDESAPSAPLFEPAEPVAEAAPALAMRAAGPQPSLATLMSRLELGLARKALALGGGAGNVTPLKREIRPVDGSLSDAIDTLQRRTAGRR